MAFTPVFYSTTEYAPRLDNAACLLEIELPSGTVYYSDQARPINTGASGAGRVYEGRVISFNPTYQGFDAGFTGGAKESTASFVLSNYIDAQSGTKLDALLPGGASATRWTGARVVYRVLDQSTSAYVSSADVILFDGRIKENGVQRGADNTITISCAGPQYNNHKTICNKQFTEQAYPDADPSIYGKVIPWIFGDWSTGWLVPAYCVDRQTMQLKIADHALSYMDTVGSILLVRNGIGILLSPSASGGTVTGLSSGHCFVDQTNNPIGMRNTQRVGTTIVFEMKPGRKLPKATVRPYVVPKEFTVEDQDQFFVNIKGYAYAGSSSRSTDNPAEVARTLLESVMGLTTPFPTESTFATALQSEFSTRRWIGAETLVSTLLEELLADIMAIGGMGYSFGAGYDRFIAMLNAYNPAPSSSDSTIDDTAIIEGSFRVEETHPEHLERIDFEYAEDPRKGAPKRRETLENVNGQAIYGVRKGQKKLFWIYNYDAAWSCAKRHLYWMNQRHQYISLDAWYRVKRNVGDADNVTFQHLSSEAVQWFEVEKQPSTVATLRGCTNEYPIAAAIYKTAAETYSGWTGQSGAAQPNGFFYGEFTIIADNSTGIPQNNKIEFDEGGGALTATITGGTYTTQAAYISAIETALDAAGANTYTFTRSASTGIWTITSNGPFTLHGSTGALAARRWFAQNGFSIASDQADLSAPHAITSGFGVPYIAWGDEQGSDFY